MIKINDILKLINNEFKKHYFKDITTHGIAELVVREDSEEKEVTRPAIIQDNGDYNFLQIDSNGLNIYHRIVGEVDIDEDADGGFGRFPLITETYPIRIIIFGNSNVFDKSCGDINLELVKEFKSLIPRRIDIKESNRISVTGFDVDKRRISREEFIEYNPESVLFTIDLEVIIKGLNVCNELKCK